MAINKGKNNINVRGNTGYTLVEVLVAMFIFVILAGIVSNTLSQVLSARKHNENTMDRLRQLQKAMVIIEQDLRQTIQRPIINEVGHREESFIENIRNKHEIIFTRAGYIHPKIHEQQSALQRVSYYQSGSKLIRKDWQTLDRNNNTKVNTRILLDNVRELKWRFADAKNKFYEIWPPVAKLQDQLPRAVEISLTVDDLGEINRLFIIAEHTVEVN